ncbi:DUF427 domain-containing protein [bacterium]|nr:DUF427 domain-containing protein [bacterium]
MAKAWWHGELLAESDDIRTMDGYDYFPPEAVNEQFFRESKTQTECPRKGTAHYYHIQVDSDVNVDAAWYYPAPKKAASHIKNYVAFWRGVEIE